MNARHMVLIGTLTFACVCAGPSESSQTTGRNATRLARAAQRSAIEKILKAREAQCIGAFGNSTFCRCINAELPLTTDFETYIGVTIAPSDEPAVFGREMVSRIKAARDRCVARMLSSIK